MNTGQRDFLVSTIDSASLLASLTELNALIDDHRLSDYWQQGVERLRTLLYADGVCIYVIELYSGKEGQLYTSGHFSDAASAEVEAQIAQLVNSTEHTDPSTTPDGDSSPQLLRFPITSDKITYGFTGLHYPEAHTFSDEQSATVQEAIKLFTDNGLRAGHLRHTRDRLERINLLYQVAQAITSTLDLTVVLSQTTQLAAGVLNAQAATLFRVDEETGELIFWIPQGTAASMLEEQRIPLAQGVVGWVATERQPLIVNDASQSPLFNPAVDVQTGFTTRTIIAVPLLVKNELVGVLEVINKEDSFGFTDDDLEWLSILGQQVATALVNAHLYTREQEKVQELATLSLVSQTINSELDVSNTLHTVTSSVLDVLPADRSELYLLLEPQQTLELFASVGHGAEEQVIPAPSISLGSGLVGWCATNNQPLALRRASDDQRYEPSDDLPELNSSSIALVPLRFRDAVKGVIVVYSLSGQRFDSEKLAVLQTFANQAAIALENATLYQDLRTEQERFIHAQEEVRHHLARELHDNTAQMLSLMTLKLRLARKLLHNTSYDKVESEIDLLEGYAQQTNREVRTLLFELRPLILETRGLIPALESYSKQLTDSMDCRIHIEVQPLDFTIRLSEASTIFSIIQEAVNNVRRHAKAENLWIRVEVDEESKILVFSVADDGTGFDASAVQQDYDRRGSFGLLNMRERAQMLGGTFNLESPRPGADNGTLALGKVPLISLIDDGSHNKSDPQ